MEWPDPSRRNRLIEAVFDEAADLEASERATYLDEACADDPELRREVESMLTALDTQAANLRRILEELPLAAPPSPDRDAESGAPSAGPLSGRRIAQYEVLEKIGGGGMGVVYRARDTRLDRLAALKFLPPYLNADEEAKARFVHEAKAASACDHPQICTIYDIGETDEGQLYIAMAYYDGETLEKRIALGPSSLRDALDCAIQIAKGLEVAHAAGIVHRDVKPANLLVTEEVVKILDFGIAKVSGVSLTRTGLTPGTITYMSPEQVRGEDLDHRTDLWSLGVVLYEMLAGRPPFEGAYFMATTYAILHTEPEPLAVQRPDVPQEVDRIVRRALQKDPARRYQRAGDLRADLERVAAAMDASTPLPLPPSRPWGRRSYRYYVAAAILVILLVNGRHWMDDLFRAPAISSIAILPLQNLSGEEEYFVDGMYDALASALARTGALRVISRRSAMGYRETEKSIQKIAQELNVDGLVEASVYREDRRVRIQVRLVQARPEERHLWAQEFEGDLENVPAMHNDVARAIAGQARATMSPEHERRLADARPVNVETYEAYLRGMYHLNKSTQEDFERGMAYLHEAVDKDPADARAYAGLAFGYVTLGHGSGARAESWPLARAAAERAVRLDSTLAEGWAALADIKLYYEWDWAGAERAFLKANAINASLAMNHYHYAWFLTLMGRVDEAISEHRLAHELDPLTAHHTVWMPGIYLWSGRFEEALTEARGAVEKYPDHATALFVLGLSAAETGAFDEAIAAHEKAASINARWTFALGRTYAMAGRTADARRILAELESQPPSPWGAYSLACLYAALGDTEEALRWLEYDPPHAWVAWSSRDPSLAPLRDDPRFEAFLDRSNLPRPIGAQEAAFRRRQPRNDAA